MLVPCFKGGHHCNWPACPLDCPGRNQRPSALASIVANHERLRFLTVDGEYPTHLIAYHPPTDTWSVFSCADKMFDPDNSWTWSGEFRHMLQASAHVRGQRDYIVKEFKRAEDIGR